MSGEVKGFAEGLAHLSAHPLQPRMERGVFVTNEVNGEVNGNVSGIILGGRKDMMQRKSKGNESR